MYSPKYSPNRDFVRFIFESPTFSLFPYLLAETLWVCVSGAEYFQHCANIFCSLLLSSAFNSLGSSSLTWPPVRGWRGTIPPLILPGLKPCRPGGWPVRCAAERLSAGQERNYRRGVSHFWFFQIPIRYFCKFCGFSLLEISFYPRMLFQNCVVKLKSVSDKTPKTSWDGCIFFGNP